MFSRRPKAILVGLALALLGLGVTALLMSRGDGPEEPAEAESGPSPSATATIGSEGSELTTKPKPKPDPKPDPKPKPKPERRTPQPEADPSQFALAERGNPVVWVLPGERVALRREPGGEVATRVGRRTEFDSPSVFAVLERDGDWVGVSSPELANGELGWIRLDQSKLGSGVSDFSIEVDLSEHRTTLLRSGRPIRSFAVTVGAPGAPTPTGRFAVTDTFEGGLGPAYGCCALALSANQPLTPSGWIGGRRIAIHGTDGTLGIDASHGCVRAADSDVAALVERVPLGTPVTITE